MLCNCPVSQSLLQLHTGTEFADPSAVVVRFSLSHIFIPTLKSMLTRCSLRTEIILQKCRVAQHALKMAVQGYHGHCQPGRYSIAPVNIGSPLSGSWSGSAIQIIIDVYVITCHEAYLFQNFDPSFSILAFIKTPCICFDCQL